MRQVWIKNTNNSTTNEIRVDFCSSFYNRLKGLMFCPRIGYYEGKLLVEGSESRINSAIHMFFMRFDIAVIWIDSKFKVVDLIIAKKWHPFYQPSSPSSYILETHPDRFADFRIGDTLLIHD
jgi:uncharacterized membrane protein (UPF0127 family)